MARSPAFYMGRLGIALLRRKQSLGIPESLFLAASLGFFYPYLFIKDSGYATLAMLLPHYVQYLALVWLLHRRKFGTAQRRRATRIAENQQQDLLIDSRLSSHSAACIYLFREYTISIGHERLFEIMYLFVALEHFYLDGLIWSFRRPHVRQTMLPFLVERPKRHRRECGDAVTDLAELARMAGFEG